jgi:hypothetical protein
MLSKQTRPVFKFCRKWEAREEDGLGMQFLEVFKTDFEDKITAEFADTVRDGNNKVQEKVCCNYLLLDPEHLGNVATAWQTSTDKMMVMGVISSATFYVGKGRPGRCYRHLKEGAKKWMNETIVNQKEFPKLGKIVDLFEKGFGVAVLTCFHSICSDEALTREAAMIKALGLSELTNLNSSSFKGKSQNWSPEDQVSLGCYLVYKASEIFKHEGCKPLYAADVYPDAYNVPFTTIIPTLK